jgi:hypothetical protein
MGHSSNFSNGFHIILGLDVIIITISSTILVRACFQVGQDEYSESVCVLDFKCIVANWIGIHLFSGGVNILTIGKFTLCM